MPQNPVCCLDNHILWPSGFFSRTASNMSQSTSLKCSGDHLHPLIKNFSAFSLLASSLIALLKSLVSFLPLTNTAPSSPGSNYFSFVRNLCRVLLSAAFLVSLSRTKFMCCSSPISVISRYLSMCPSTRSYLIVAIILFLVILMFLRILAQLDPGRTLLLFCFAMLIAPMLSRQIFVVQFSIL